ncbi:MAG TPA: response regulator transcription factor [Pirellulales bacterium]|nr:response regulator transcription factor [Pirellulales bacterium]
MSYEPTKSARARKVRILIVDDHPLVREGLIGLIGSQSDFEVCGEAAGMDDARRLVESARPDVAIIDLTLSDGSGIELIKELKERRADLKLLVLSMHEESLFAERALRAGAVGYVHKHEASRTIVQAVRTVLEGRLYLSQRLTQRMLERAVRPGGDTGASPIERLTDREMEVFELLGEGLTSRQIATRLQLSPKTVETHREHIKDKLDLKNGTELTKHALQWVLERH